MPVEICTFPKGLLHPAAEEITESDPVILEGIERGLGQRRALDPLETLVLVPDLPDELKGRSEFRLTIGRDPRFGWIVYYEKDRKDIMRPKSKPLHLHPNTAVNGEDYDGVVFTLCRPGPTPEEKLVDVVVFNTG